MNTNYVNEIYQKLDSYVENLNIVKQNHMLLGAKDLNLDLKISITEINVLVQIDKDNNVCANDLAKYFNLTRGGMSKLIKRLINMNLVETYYEDDNKKRQLLKITDMSKKIVEYHNMLEKEAFKNFKDKLKGFSEDEMEIILKFLNQIN